MELFDANGAAMMGAKGIMENTDEDRAVSMLLDKIADSRSEDEKLRAEAVGLRARLAVLTGALHMIREATEGVDGAQQVNLVARMALADAGLGFDGEV